MEINITTNHLRLLSDTFMFIGHKTTIVEGRTYKCTSDKYGILGDAECLSEFKTQLYNLPVSAMRLTDGNTNTINELKRKGAKNLDNVQCCVFRFKRRNDDAFRELIDKETVKAGMKITRQNSLF